MCYMTMSLIILLAFGNDKKISIVLDDIRKVSIKIILILSFKHTFYVGLAHKYR